LVVLLLLVELYSCLCYNYRMASTSKNELDFLEEFHHETPFFVFSKKKILDKYHEFQKSFPKATIHYAIKANSEPELLKLLFEAGSSFEVASKYELDFLKALKVPPERILYGTSVKPALHIKEFQHYGVDRFSFDSLSELEKIAQVAPGARVYCRMNVNDSGSIYRFSEKFGTSKSNITLLLERARDLGLHPYGISFHVGSQAGNEKAWAYALENIIEAMEHLQKVGIKIDMINLGGGYPCNAYISSENTFKLKDVAKHTLKVIKKLPYQPRIIIEPGRGIVAETGILVTSIIAKVERDEHTWLFLDAGVYNALFESLSYQGSIRYKITSMRPIHNQGEALFALAGPTGDSWDIVTREALLPRDINVGDKLVFHDVGAYNTVFMNRFNGFPHTPVYFV